MAAIFLIYSTSRSELDVGITQNAVNTTLVHPTISTVHGDQIVFNYDINHGKNELVEDLGERILSYL